MADRIGIPLSEGGLVQVGTPGEDLRAPQLPLQRELHR